MDQHSDEHPGAAVGRTGSFGQIGPANEVWARGAQGAAACPMGSCASTRVRQSHLPWCMEGECGAITIVYGMYNPFGHIPGFHIPGTTTPIGYAVAMGQLRPVPMQRALNPGELAAREAAKTRWAEDCRVWGEAIRAELSSLPFPAQITRVMMRAASAGYPSGRVVQVDLPLVQRLLPTVGEHFDPSNPPWRDADIAQWFASASLRPAGPVKVGERRTLFFGSKDLTVDGWVFAGGSTALWEHPDRQSRWLLTCGVTSRGERLYARSGYGGQVSLAPETPRDRFNGLALKAMGELAGLKAVSEPPPLPAELRNPLGSPSI